nr:unnamed protein product [Digitaria exilis]
MARTYGHVTCRSPSVSYCSISPSHPLSRSAAAYARSRGRKSSSPDDVTATREHASFRSSDAGSDSGFTSGSSMPYRPPQMNDHVASYCRRVELSVVSPATGFLPQKYGSRSRSPVMAAPPSTSSVPARIAMLCAMLAPALSPARKRRERLPRSRSHGSGPDAAFLATQLSACHESLYAQEDAQQGGGGEEEEQGE